VTQQPSSILAAVDTQAGRATSERDPQWPTAQQAEWVPPSEFHKPRWAHVVLRSVGEGEGEGNSRCEGWAQVDGSWLHLLSEEHDGWMTWPLERVICIEWKAG
jgi:hypothetical protein